MTDVTIEDSDTDPELESVQGAAVAQGAAQVHEQQAHEAAEQAETAASVAAAAAEGAEGAGELAAAAAQGAETSAMEMRDLVAGLTTAMQAHAAAMNELVEQIRAAAPSPAPPVPQQSPPRRSEKPPASRRRGSWYWGG